MKKFHSLFTWTLFFLKGYIVEKILALRLLAQLCFNEEIAVEVACDTDLCSYLQDQIQQNRNKDLKRVAQVILWSINKESTEPDKKKHVFISFSASTRPACDGRHQKWHFSSSWRWRHQHREIESSHWPESLRACMHMREVSRERKVPGGGFILA